MTPLKATVSEQHCESFGYGSHISSIHYVLSISLPNGNIILSETYKNSEEAFAVEAILNNAFSKNTSDLEKRIAELEDRIEGWVRD